VDRRVDLGLGVVVVALGLAVLFLTTRIRTTVIIDPVGPRGFGYVLGAALVVGGTLVALARVRRWNESGGSNIVPSDGAADEDGTPSSALRPILVVASAGVYVMLLQPLGFLLTTPVFLGGLLQLMQTRSVRGRIIIPLAFTAIVFVVFSQGLNVNLPVGPFRPIFVRYGLLSY